VTPLSLKGCLARISVFCILAWLLFFGGWQSIEAKSGISPNVVAVIPDPFTWLLS